MHLKIAEDSVHIRGQDRKGEAETSEPGYGALHLCPGEGEHAGVGVRSAHSLVPRVGAWVALNLG